MHMPLHHTASSQVYDLDFHFSIFEDFRSGSEIHWPSYEIKLLKETYTGHPIQTEDELGSLITDMFAKAFFFAFTSKVLENNINFGKYAMADLKRRVS